VRVPVIFRKEHPPLLVFVVIPIVIILVVSIVDSDLVRWRLEVRWRP
jgi:hypothetical protein